MTILQTILQKLDEEQRNYGEGSNSFARTLILKAIENERIAITAPVDAQNGQITVEVVEYY